MKKRHYAHIKISQAAMLGLPPENYFIVVLLGLDVFVNSILGGKAYQTISCRLGESISSGGWASRVPWPAWFHAHCIDSVYETTV